MKVLFIGDVIGSPGRRAIKTMLGKVREDHAIDLTIANAENLAGGFGVTPDILAETAALGIEGFTSGNHIWDKKEIIDQLDRIPNLIRPINYPPGNPGRGAMVLETKKGVRLGVINLMGRAHMPPCDCPFRAAAAAVEEMINSTPCIVVDMHCETTSEKNAMGWYLNGRVSAVVGTHTHVQTADARILPGGTAYITDIGLTGGMDSVIGMETGMSIEKFLSGRPVRYELAKDNLHFQAVVIDIDDKMGHANAITRLSLPV